MVCFESGWIRKKGRNAFIIRAILHSGHQQNIKALHLYSNWERIHNRLSVLVSDTHAIAVVNSRSNLFAYCTSQHLVTIYKMSKHWALKESMTVIVFIIAFNSLPKALTSLSCKHRCCVWAVNATWRFNFTQISERHWEIVFISYTDERRVKKINYALLISLI